MKLFFDVDGVLIDGWHANPERRKPWDVSMEEDLGVPREAFRDRFFLDRDTAALSPMERCVKGDADLLEELAKVLPDLGYRGSARSFADYWFQKDSNINQEVLGIARQLSQNPNHHLFIATGQEHHRAHYLWDRLGFKRTFRDIFYSAKLGHLKNTPAFFETINAALMISPDERPLFFDDQPLVVDLAKQAGWDAVLFNTIEDMLSNPRLQSLLKGARA